MTKNWLITGCSSGFGQLLAERVLQRGDNVVLTARKTDDLENLGEAYPKTSRVSVLDVTRAGDAAAAVALAEREFGGLDILVNNAGYGFVGAIEEATPAEYRPMYETNLFGLIETTRAALPALGKRPGGRIVNFSSIGGLEGRAGFGYYNGTKFAVEGISEALAQEVAPLGIAVIIVEPGAFRTAFLGRSIAHAARQLPRYASTVAKTRAYREQNNGQQAGDPARAITVLLKAIDADKPPLHLLLGKDAYARARGKVDALLADMKVWQADATTTGFLD